MIARDEGRASRPIHIESLGNRFGVRVAVDTGSRDDTVSVLEQAGFQVRRQLWRDDFSAARNASLADVPGDWILVLDAAGRVRLFRNDPHIRFEGRVSERVNGSITEHGGRIRSAAVVLYHFPDEGAAAQRRQQGLAG